MLGFSDPGSARAGLLTNIGEGWPLNAWRPMTPAGAPGAVGLPAHSTRLLLLIAYAPGKGCCRFLRLLKMLGGR